MMLSVQQIKKSYGTEPVLNGVSFTLQTGERIGLVGENGTGKTTLLRIIAGEERPDSGSVQLTPASARLGYLPQGLTDGLTEPIGSFLDRMLGDLNALSDRLSALADQMSAAPDDEALHSEYDSILLRLERSAETTGSTESVLTALGLQEVDRATPIQHLSGGQKTRLALAGALLQSPQVLLLDEPTNHLDFTMLDWLENWLLGYPGAVLVVSHDRAFLDAVATRILEIDPHTRTLNAYDGNYSAYLDAKISERERQWQAYQNQQEEIARLRSAAAHMRSRAKFHKGGKTDPATGTDGFSIGFFANRGKEVIQKAKNIEKRIQRMLTEDRIDKPACTWQMKMDFGETAATGRDVLALEGVSIGYGQRVLLSDINLTLRQGARAALVGPNGSGKTTLLRTVAGQIEPLAGRIRLGTHVKIGYMSQEQENLDPTLTPLTTLEKLSPMNETEQRAFLSKFLFKGDDVFVPVGKLSFGERARLTLACLVASGCNFLMLDEPINHLDIPSRARFEQALEAFDGTVLAVVHDRYFVAGFANVLWLVTETGIRQEDRLDEPLSV
jgi:ATP-binding cassette subfamily F protein 3